MAATADVDGDEVVVNGRKWWSTGVGHPDCGMLHLHGSHRSGGRPPSPPLDGAGPHDAPGVTRRAHALHDGLRTTSPAATARSPSTTSACPPPTSSSAPGRAFEIAQGRLGPGRVHHCMRAIGLAEMALELACKRGLDAHGVRQADRQPRRQPRADRRRPHRHQPVTPARAPRRVAARQRKRPRGAGCGVGEIKVAAPAWPARSSTWPSRSTAAAA